jgi:hypothetical protein
MLIRARPLRTSSSSSNLALLDRFIKIDRKPGTAFVFSIQAPDDRLHFYSEVKNAMCPHFRAENGGTAMEVDFLPQKFAKTDTFQDNE